MSAAKTAAAPAAKPAGPSFTPVLIYGIIADCLVILPIILYIATGGFARFHQTMINMLVSAWMPFAITWIIGMVADGPMARAAMEGAMNMAGLGPMCVQWVGLMGFIMAAHSAGNLAAW